MISMCPLCCRQHIAFAYLELTRMTSFPRRPAVVYPKLKTKPRSAPQTFIPGGSKLDASDPRKSTKRRVAVPAPRLTGRPGNSEYSDSIDAELGVGRYIPSRRSASEIKAELDEIEMRRRHYRPAHVQPISSDKEKERLAQICEYKGGKGLPAEMVGAVMEAPFERANRLREVDRIEKVRAKYRTSVPVAPAAPLSHSEIMKQQITGEINERIDYLEEMRLVGGIDRRKETQLKSEVAQRLTELKRLEASS